MAFLAKYCRSYIGLGTLLGILIQFLNYYTYFLKFFSPYSLLAIWKIPLIILACCGRGEGRNNWYKSRGFFYCLHILYLYALSEQYLAKAEAAGSKWYKMRFAHMWTLLLHDRGGWCSAWVCRVILHGQCSSPATHQTYHRTSLACAMGSSERCSQWKESAPPESSGNPSLQTWQRR